MQNGPLRQWRNQAGKIRQHQDFPIGPEESYGPIPCLASDDRLLLGVSSGRIGIKGLGEDIGIKAFQPQCHDLR